MPIPQHVVDRYIRDVGEPLTEYKDLLPLEVEECLATMNPRHRFTVPGFRLDQKICFLLGAAYPGIMLMTDMGLGKTAVSLELLTYFYENDYVRRAFILVPTNELGEGWEDEIKKWGFPLPHVRLSYSSSADKWKQFHDFEDGLIIGTYVGVGAMVSTLQQKKDQAGNLEDGKKRVVNKALLRQLTDNVDATVFDQSTALGSKTSLSFQVCDALSRKAQIRYALAGRAFGRDAFVLWSQMLLVDRGAALGTSIGMYREAFWRREKHRFGTTWVPRKRKEPDLAKKLARSSIRYAAEECVDLPSRTDTIKYFSLSEDAWGFYSNISDDLLAAAGNFREVKSSFLRLRQISSGFVGFVNDDTGEKAQLEFSTNPKLDLLLSILDEIPEDRKVIIFHEFTFSGSLICQALNKTKRRFGWLWGGTKNWTEIKDAFNNEPDYRILVANHKKGGQGLNLQAASYCIFYESPVSAIQRPECERRIYRVGQKQRTFFYDLVMRNGVDEDILQFHQDGKDLMKSLVEDPARYLRKNKGA